MKKLLFSFSIYLLSLSQLMATGSNNGTNCNNAYSYPMGQYVTLNFTNLQEDYYLEFTANDTDLVAQIIDTGFSSFAKINEIQLHSRSSCSNLVLLKTVMAEQLHHFDNDANYLSMENLTIGENYLLIIKRDPGQSLPAASLRFINKTLIKTDCPLTTGLPPGEMIYNGDYTYTSVEEPLLFGAHVDEEVCNWSAASGTPDYTYIGPNATFPARNDPNGALIQDPYSTLAIGYRNSQNNSVFAESIVTDFAFPLEAGDQLFLSARAVSLYADEVRFVRFVLAHSKDIDNIASPASRNINDILSSGQLIGEITDTELDAYVNGQDFELFTFCEEADEAFDRLLIYVHIPNGINGFRIGAVGLDNVSLINMRQISDLPDVEINYCNDLTGHYINGEQSGPPEFEYQWVPTIGLNDAEVFNPFTVSTNIANAYTLNMTHSSNSCTATATVNISYSQEPFSAGTNQFISQPCQKVVIGPDCVIPGATYAWTPSTGLSNPNVANPKVTPPSVNGNSTQTYTLTVTLPNGTVSSTFFFGYRNLFQFCQHQYHCRRLNSG